MPGSRSFIARFLPPPSLNSSPSCIIWARVAPENPSAHCAPFLKAGQLGVIKRFLWLRAINWRPPQRAMRTDQLRDLWHQQRHATASSRSSRRCRGESVGYLVVHRDCVRIVIDRGEVEVRRLCEHRGKPKRSAQSGVEAEFSNEFALLGELYNFAWVSGVRVYGVTIGGNQVSIGREHQSKRTAQVARVVKHHRSLIYGNDSVAGARHREDCVIACGRHIEHVRCRIVSQSRWTHYQRRRVRPEGVTLSDPDYLH